MKFVLLFAFVAVASAYVADLDKPALSEKIINQVNGANGATWTAGRNEIFEGMTVGEARKYLGGLLTPVDLPVNKFAAPGAGVKKCKKEFEVAKKFPKCADLVNTIRDQGRCGSCWAFAASEFIQDRFCIETKGDHQVVLSPQDFVSCDKGDFGCNGGYLMTPLQYSAREGIVSDECFPYTSGETSVDGDCLIKDGECPSGAEYKKYYTKGAYDTGGEDTMCDTLNDGPLEIGFSVYQDFLAYKSGVYTHTSGGLLGGHAVKIIGYGEEDDTPYWLVANSWGESWGMDGFFKIKRGNNECSLESQAVAAYADTSRL